MYARTFRGGLLLYLCCLSKGSNKKVFQACRHTNTQLLPPTTYLQVRKNLKNVLLLPYLVPTVGSENLRQHKVNAVF